METLDHIPSHIFGIKITTRVKVILRRKRTRIDTHLRLRRNHERLHLNPNLTSKSSSCSSTAATTSSASTSSTMSSSTATRTTLQHPRRFAKVAIDCFKTILIELSEIGRSCNPFCSHSLSRTGRKTKVVSILKECTDLNSSENHCSERYYLFDF